MTIEQKANVTRIEFSEEQTKYFISVGTSDHSNALCLEYLNPGTFANVVGWGIMYWNGVYWQKDDNEAYLYDKAVEMMTVKHLAMFHAPVDAFKGDEPKKTKKAFEESASTNRSKINNCISSFKQFLSVQRSVKWFNNQHHLLNVQNGVVDLRNGELLEHDSNYGFTWVAPVDYDPSKCSKDWDNFLSEVLQDYDQTKGFLQQVVGYAITGNTNMEKLVYIYGPSRSGKSTFLMLLQSLLGDSAAKGTSFTSFTRSRQQDQGFDLANLVDARLVVASEGESGVKMNESVIKSLSGRDMIQCAKKGQQAVEVYPVWKIFLASNFKPKAQVSDESFWGRLILINFPNSKLGAEDVNLKENLSTPDNLSGILNWAIQGSISYYQNNKQLFPTPKCFVDALNEAREEIDFVAQWMADCCIVDKENSDLKIAVTDANASFRNWCLDNALDAWKNNTVASILNDKKFSKTTIRVKRIYLNSEDKATGRFERLSGMLEPTPTKGYKGFTLKEALEPWES